MEIFYQAGIVKRWVKEMTSARKHGKEQK